MVTEWMCSDVEPIPGEIFPPLVAVIEQASNPLQLESRHFVSNQDSPETARRGASAANTTTD